jgi:hypothetical protein
MPDQPPAHERRKSLRQQPISASKSAASTCVNNKPHPMEGEERWAMMRHCEITYPVSPGDARYRGPCLMFFIECSKAPAAFFLFAEVLIAQLLEGAY